MISNKIINAWKVLYFYTSWFELYCSLYEFIRLKVQKTFDVHSYCIYLLLLQLIIRVHVSCNDKWNEKLQRNFKG